MRCDIKVIIKKYIKHPSKSDSIVNGNLTSQDLQEGASLQMTLKIVFP